MFKQTLCNLSLKRDNYVKITLSNDGVRWVLHFSSSATEVQVTPSPIPLEAFAKGVEEVIASVNRCEVKWGISLGGGALVADVEREKPRISQKVCWGGEGVADPSRWNSSASARVSNAVQCCENCSSTSIDSLGKKEISNCLHKHRWTHIASTSNNHWVLETLIIIKII